MPSQPRPPLRWEPDEPVGTLIKRVRTWWGRSQHTLSAQLHEVSRNTAITCAAVSHWETGRNIPTPYWRGYLAKVLDIPLDVLDRAAVVSAAPRSRPQAPCEGSPAPGGSPATGPPPASPATTGPSQQPATTQVGRPGSAAAGAATRPGLMLTTAQAITMLDVTTGELASLIATGRLRPDRFSDPGAGRYPARQIEALLNRPGGVPRDDRPGLLHALSQALTAGAGSGLNCQLRHHGPHPHLVIRATGGTQLTVWAVPTSAGSRFWWGQGRSHAAADPPGAATAITVALAPPPDPHRAGQPTGTPARPAQHPCHVPHDLREGPDPRTGRAASNSRRLVDEAKVINAYRDEGLIVQECADRFGISPRRILEILREHGVPTRPRGKSKDLDPAADQAVITAYRDFRLSQQQCADWFGISPGTVAQTLRRHAVPVRTDGVRHVADPAQVPGLPPRNAEPKRTYQKVDPGTEQAVITAYRDQRLTMNQCAERSSTSRATVKRILRRHDVPIRPKGGPSQAR